MNQLNSLTDSPQRAFRLSKEQRASLRRQFDIDPWLFSCIICQHAQGGIERFHKPLLYFQAGSACAELLAVALDDPECQSEFTEQLKGELNRLRINWRDPAHLRALRRALRRVNNRIARSTGKTVYGLDAELWHASRDPDQTIGLASKSDPAAEAMCMSIGKIMLTDEYISFYPDRIYPKSPDKFINQNWIRFNGRKLTDGETIEARGINSQWTLHHYSRIRGDDIVGTESGEAKLDDALRWIANLHGISRSEYLGGSEYAFNGTVTGPNDDYSVLKENPQYITVCVPIWKKSVPHTIANIRLDGEPTLSEWYPLEVIRAMRDDTIANPKLGVLWWLQNFDMAAHQEGVVLFTQDQIKGCLYSWVHNSATGRDWIRRYLWRKDAQTGNWLPVYQTDGERLVLDPVSGKPVQAYLDYDPMSLPRAVGIDQAYSEEKWANRWSITFGSVDPQGYRYELETVSGKGYQYMIAALPVLLRKWTENWQNPIRKIGLETGAMQGVSADWLKRDSDFKRIARLIEPVHNSSIRKSARILTNVYAPMEMRELLLNPNSVTLHSRMLKFRPNDDDNQDDELDSLSICMQMLQRPDSAASDAEMIQAAIVREREDMRLVHPGTFIDQSPDWLTYLGNG